MIKTKTCSKCHETKSLDEFPDRKDSKDGKRGACKKCVKKYHEKYNQEHKEEMSEQHKEYRREHKNEIIQKRGCHTMYKNKKSTLYLGIVIAERLIRHLFKDVEVMPYGNTGYDFVCNKGKKIDVKSGRVTFSDGRPRWTFNIDYNKKCDFFILVAFDNLIDLNPLHLWMIPGKELNKQTSASVSPSTLHKWRQWKRDIKDAQLCCAEMRNQLK